MKVSSRKKIDLLIFSKQRSLRIDFWADLCSPVKRSVVHQPVVHRVGRSVEPVKNHHCRHCKRKRSFILNSGLTSRSIFSCTKPENRRRLRLRAAAVRWQCPHTRRLRREDMFRGINRVCRETGNKFKWCTLIELSREMRLFITQLPLLWFGGWNGCDWFLLHMAAVACPSWITPTIRYQRREQSYAEARRSVTPSISTMNGGKHYEKNAQNAPCCHPASLF